MSLFNFWVLLLGTLLVGRSGYRLFPIVQYYMSWRRDLYFMTDQDWARLTGDYLGGTMMGMGVLSLQTLWTESMGLAFLGFAVGLFCSLLLSTLGHRVVPRRPGWVRRFEAGRAVGEVTYIRERGSRALRNDPQRFRRFINSTGGWDSWLMTVV